MRTSNCAAAAELLNLPRIIPQTRAKEKNAIAPVILFPFRSECLRLIDVNEKSGAAIFLLLLLIMIAFCILLPRTLSAQIIHALFAPLPAVRPFVCASATLRLCDKVFAHKNKNGPDKTTSGPRRNNSFLTSLATILAISTTATHRRPVLPRPRNIHRQLTALEVLIVEYLHRLVRFG